MVPLAGAARGYAFFPPDSAYHTQPMTDRPFIRKSSGFTMIEILVALGILILLIGVVAFTIGGLTSSAKVRQTKVRLESLSAMLTELETTAGLRRQPGKMFYDSPATAYTNPNTPGVVTFDIWRDANPADDNDTPTPAFQPARAPGNVGVDAFRAGRNDRTGAAAVGNTQLVMGLLLSIPRNQEAFNQFPPDSVMENPVKDTAIPDSRLGILTTANATNRRAPLRPPLALDAWGNPILFVPSAGLTGVNLGFKGGRDTASAANFERPNVTMTSTGPQPTPSDITQYRPPAGARPFFVSAGEDGDFTTGDDNVYSFEN
jgi:type II secretory pathway pseudopilin PulG